MRRLVIGAIVIALASGGLLAYGRVRPQRATARPDPAVTVATAIGALLRSEAHGLTDSQVASILPLLRVLRDTDANDAEVTAALGREIMGMLTPDQRAEVTRLRDAAVRSREAERSAGGAQPQARRVVQGRASGGATGSAAARSQMRSRVLARVIERLEQREEPTE